MARRRGKKQTTNNNWHEQPQLADTELQLGEEAGGQLGNHLAEDTQYYTQHCSRATVV